MSDTEQPITAPTEPITEPTTEQTTTETKSTSSLFPPLNHIDPQSTTPRDKQLVAEDTTIITKNDPFFVDANIPSLVADLSSDDQKVVYRAAYGLRVILTASTAIPIESLVGIDNSVVLLMRLLKSEDIRILFEALWVLTNICSGATPIIKQVIDLNIIPELMKLLDYPHHEIVNQALWALGNIAGDFRDEVFKHEYIYRITQVSSAPALRLSVLRTYTWFVSNLLRGKPDPNYELVAALLPFLVQLLRVADLDSEVCADLAWTLSFATSGGSCDLVADYFLQHNVFPLIVDLLAKPNRNIATPALRTVGNIMSSDQSKFTQQLLNDGILNHLVDIVGKKSVAMRKEAAWIFSNIAAGNVDQVEFLAASNAFEILCKLISQCDLQTRTELYWVVVNVTNCVTDFAPKESQETIMKKLFSTGWVEQWTQSMLIDTQNDTTLRLYLETITNILNYGERRAILHAVADNEKKDGVENNKKPINLSAMMLGRAGAQAVLRKSAETEVGEHTSKGALDNIKTAQDLLAKYF